jgi:hypothetical protein
MGLLVLHPLKHPDPDSLVIWDAFNGEISLTNPVGITGPAGLRRGSLFEAYAIKVTKIGHADVVGFNPLRLTTET